MKKIAEVIECTSMEYAGLVSKLSNTEGFRVSRPKPITRTRDVYHEEHRDGKIGYFEKIDDVVNLYVYTAEGLGGVGVSPLAKFMEWYMTVGKGTPAEFVWSNENE